MYSNYHFYFFNEEAKSIKYQFTAITESLDKAIKEKLEYLIRRHKGWLSYSNINTVKPFPDELVITIIPNWDWSYHAGTRYKPSSGKVLNLMIKVSYITYENDREYKNEEDINVVINVEPLDNKKYIEGVTTI